MLVGFVARMVEHTTIFPVDTLRTRMVGLGSCDYSGVGRSFRYIVKSKVALGFYRGIGAMSLGVGSTRLVHFSICEVCKEKLNCNLVL
ncbi:hypothetical protein SUGI_0656520 [Cryptomeria japonica]|nr:hypothetical protein SUGI_0656520 [Cryptomeria japonica]